MKEYPLALLSESAFFKRVMFPYHMFSKVGYTQARKNPWGHQEDCRGLAGVLGQEDRVVLRAFDEHG